MERSIHFFALGTENRICAVGKRAGRALTAAAARVLELEGCMSAFRETSEISDIAHHAGIAPVPVSEDLFTVLKKAREISEASGGAFDVTLRPLTKLWHFGAEERIPDNRELSILTTSGRLGYRQLLLDERKKTAYLPLPGCGLDLGGIAKGYAADEVRRVLLSYHVESALINLGGNILTVGKPPERGYWKIGIQNPLAPRGIHAFILEMGTGSVVTSAVNERFFVRQGKRYHHILNPETGQPAESGLLSVTVLDDSSLQADALSTAAFVLGLDAGVRLIQSMQASAVVITSAGEIYTACPTGISQVSAGPTPAFRHPAA